MKTLSKVGGNSFEGNLLYLSDEENRKDFKSNQMGIAFAGLLVYEVVPLWQQEFIFEKYFEAYRHLFTNDPIQLSFLTSEDAFMLSALIYGDFGFRRPSLQNSKQYQKCGSKVYSYFLDVETQWDPG